MTNYVRIEERRSGIGSCPPQKNTGVSRANNRMIIYFDSEGVRKLVEHTKKYPKMHPSLEHLFDKSFWKKGARPNRFGFVESCDVDTSKIQPYLSLVKDSDSGACLMMSGSQKRLTDGDENFVVYGKGYKPQAGQNKSIDVFGGGRDGMFLTIPLDWFEKMLEKTGIIKLDV